MFRTAGKDASCVRLPAFVHDPRVELYASHEVQWMMRA
jgi:hypothetical protein